MHDNDDLPTHPGALLGFRNDGRPIYLMAGGAPDDDGAGSGDDGDDTDDGADDTDDDDSEDEDDDDKPLGPKGEKALAAEKDKRRKAAERARTAEQRAQRLQTELDRLKGGKNGKSGGDGREDKDDDDTDAAAAQAEARANAKIVRAEVKALAADTFADPSDAHLYLDLSKYEVDDDGDLVDSDDLAEDLKDVLKRKPHLARKGRRFGGGADGGARDDNGKPKRQPGLDRMRGAYEDSERSRKK